MLHVCMCLVLLAAAGTSALDEAYEADYYANVTLPCNYTRHGLIYPGLNVPIKRYWVMPNGTVLPDTFTSDGRFTLYRTTSLDFTLIVSGIDEADFGVYQCLLLWNNFDYRVDVVNIGLNVDGPYYKKRLEEFELYVIIGCSVAGTVFVVVLIGCIFCSCKNCRMSRDREKRQTLEQGAKLRSVYEYGENTGLERKASEGKQVHSNPEVYAKVDTRGSLTDNTQTEEMGSQSVHF